MTALLRAFMFGLLVGMVVKMLRTTPMPPRNAWIQRPNRIIDIYDDLPMTGTDG